MRRSPRDHRIEYEGDGVYRLYWRTDRRSPATGIKHEAMQSRETDIAGAARFARRWNVDMPEDDDRD